MVWLPCRGRVIRRDSWGIPLDSLHALVRLDRTRLDSAFGRYELTLTAADDVQK